MTYNYIDVHSHISWEAFGEDRDLVLRDMGVLGIATITVGFDAESSRAAVACAKQYEHVFAAIGIHPDEAKKELFDSSAFEELVKDPKVVAVGECGLDYYRIDESNVAAKNLQKEQFHLQIDFAVAHDKPLMLHGRPQKGTMDAYEDMLELLEGLKAKHGERLRGNIHFFVGTTAIGRRFNALGFTVSFTGVVTFSNDYDDAVRELPLAMILAETDSPYATPAPHRGKRNDPRYLPEIIDRIAQLRRESTETVRMATTDNAIRVFGLGA